MKFIVMEHIHEYTIQETWDTFADQEKKNLVIQMRGYMVEMRRIKSPGGYCSLNQQPLLDFQQPHQQQNVKFVDIHSARMEDREWIAPS